MSFAKEMSDFNNAFQSTTKTFDDHAYKQTLDKYYESNTNDDEDDELDKEQKKANIAATNARTAASNASLGLNGLRKQLLQTQIQSYNQPQPSAADSAGPVPSMTTPIQSTPAVGGATAAPATPQGNAPANTPGYAAGGPVQVYQSQNNLQDQADASAGGDPMNQQDSPMVHQQMVQQQQAQAQPAVGGDDDSDDDDSDDDDGNVPSSSSALPYSVAGAMDANIGGLTFLHGQHGLNGPPQAIQAGYHPGTRNYVRGAGAAQAADMASLYKKIDPNNQLSDSQRNLAAMNAMWQFKLKNGDLKGAQQAAGSMLQFYRQASGRYAAIAAAAAQHGNLDAATKFAMKAYANIPDGNDMQLSVTPQGQIQYTYSDAQGNKISGGIATPQQFMGQLTGVTQNFDKFLINAAGQSLGKGGQQGAVGGAGKPMKPQDRDTVMNDIDQSFGQQFTNPDGTPQKMPDEQMRALKGAALRIVSDPRNTMTADEAVNLAKRLSSPNAKDPNNPGFKATKLGDDDGGGYMVKLDKGPAFHVSEGDFDAAADMRLEQQTTLKKQADKAAADAKKPSLASDVGAKLQQFGKDVAADAPKQAFPGGTSSDTSQAIPATPDDDDNQPRQRPYVPFIAGGK